MAAPVNSTASIPCDEVASKILSSPPVSVADTLDEKLKGVDNWPIKTKSDKKKKPTKPSTNTDTNDAPIGSAPLTRTSLRRIIRPPQRDLPDNQLQHDSKPRYRGAGHGGCIPPSLRQCRHILRELMSQKHQAIAHVFCNPVNPQDAPDYGTVIHHPMDLGTIRVKMDKREYAAAQEFAQDVRLIFSNCYLYNPMGNQCVVMAQQLQAIFEARYNKVTDLLLREKFQERHTPKSSSSRQSKRKRRKRSKLSKPVPVIETSTVQEEEDSEWNDDDKSDVVDEAAELRKGRLLLLHEQVLSIEKHLARLANKEKTLKHRLEKPPGKSSHEKCLFGKTFNQEKVTIQPATSSSQPSTSSAEYRSTSDEDEEESSVPMTRDEKRVLSQNMLKLPDDKMRTLVSIIQQNEPEFACDKKNDDELEIDLDLFNDMTLRCLQRYVMEIVIRGGKRRRKPGSASDGERVKKPKKRKKKNIRSSIRPDSLRGHSTRKSSTARTLNSHTSDTEEDTCALVVD